MLNTIMALGMFLLGSLIIIGLTFISVRTNFWNNFFKKNDEFWDKLSNKINNK